MNGVKTLNFKVSLKLSGISLIEPHTHPVLRISKQI